MKIISTKMHGFLDYTVALVIIALPWLFDFDSGPQAWILVTSGIITISYSLLTRYEYSVAGVVPFSFHLILDSLSGIVIACSPWLFGFHRSIYLPHIIIGILEITVVLLSKSPSRLLNKKRQRRS